MSKTAKAPPGLKAAGRRLWQSITAAYELREDERQALLAACRTADELERLEDALKDAEPIVSGSAGQVRAHPLFAEARAHRLALRQLLASVGLAEGEAERHAGAARSRAGSQLARVRWGQARG